ncbi:MAG: MaoC family dehydratase N-terminal domain-containing protein, partial [Oscillospiraceae bacterium]|nr:MaoC family dehydratase N-terminal domain-containing protein [Oscillospiraceae bacterium]
SNKYNPIPIRCDELYAKQTKFGRVIASGYMSFLAVWAEFMKNDIFGEQLIAGKSSKIEWFRPVFADDVLTGTVTVTNITRRNDYNGIAEITIEILNQENELVLTNITESIVKYHHD